MNCRYKAFLVQDPRVYVGKVTGYREKNRKYLVTSRKNGARDRTRTCDLYRVKVAF